MLNVNDIRIMFKEKYKNSDFILDKSGSKLLELLGISYIVDEDVIFGNINLDYANRELEWYKGMSLNVNDIPGEVPKIWKEVSSKDGYINSNYGWCIFSDDNFNQFKNSINELKNNKFSRRALMIYNRPSMWNEYNKDGMSDFICTTSVMLIIRNSRLYYIINQRSCDAVFGFKNDMFWHRYVFNEAFNELKNIYNDLEKGDIIHQVGSLHLYERHFKFIE